MIHPTRESVTAELVMVVFVYREAHGLEFVQEALKAVSDVGARAIQVHEGWMLMFRRAESYAEWRKLVFGA